MLSTALVLFLALVTAYLLTLGRNSSPHSPPCFSIPYLPSFLSGLVAIVQLGADEDGFLKKLQLEYGSVVYLPWPLKQYLVLEATPIDQVYKANSKVLSFLPIRREMQKTVFDAGEYWKDIDTMGAFYKVHSRGLQKSQLDSSVARFVSVMERQVEELATRLDSTKGGELELNLDERVTDMFFEASLVGLFGPRMREPSGISKEAFRKAFDEFDGAFPLLASGLLPLPLANLIFWKGKKSQHVLADTLQQWVEEGFPGLEEGVIRDMAQVAIDRGLGTKEAGKVLVADAWALQANAPYVVSQLLLYLLQSPPSLFSDVLSEIDHSTSLAYSTSSSPLTIDHLSQHLPLLQSCITETLRIGTSVFSIRDVQQPVRLDSGRREGGNEVVVPSNSRVICATRASHLDKRLWGDTVEEWDGKRFFDGDGETIEDENGKLVPKSQQSRQVWGFGGGISRCEGNVLATMELKSFASIILSKFELTLLGPSSEGAEHYEPVKFIGTKDGIRPKRKTGRVGLGVLQFDHDVRVKIRRRPSRQTNASQS